MQSTEEASLVAPCGMNCGICLAYLRKKNSCPGCRGPNDKKPITRVRCKIKTCERFLTENAQFCFQCKDFPCPNLKRLDKRYRTKYNMSMIENLEQIKKRGLAKFQAIDKLKWTCSKCGSIICVHTGLCVNCGNKQKSADAATAFSGKGISEDKRTSLCKEPIREG
jgi:hypothetical protein